MQDTDPTPRGNVGGVGGAAAVSKKRATSTSPPPASFTNGSNNKRQRLDSKEPAEEKATTADFISLDFSDGEGEKGEDEDGEEDELELIAQRPQPASIALESFSEEDDTEEGGMKEKTLKKKTQLMPRGKHNNKELDTPSAQTEEQSEQPNSAAEEDLSEEGGIKIPVTNGHGDSKETEEEEEEDKDSSTRRAMQAKMKNNTQIPEEDSKTGETTITTTITTTVTSDTSSSERSSEDDDIPVIENGVEVFARQKTKEKREKKRKEEKKQRKAARQERRNKSQIDLPKGGDFSNLEEVERIDISSDDDDDDLQINVDMNMDDLVEQQEDRPDNGEAQPQVKGKADDGEEMEVEELAGNGGVAGSGEEIDSDESDDGNDSPFLDQTTAAEQRKYYTAYAAPPFEHAEARPYFSVVKNPDFSIDLVREKEAAAPHKMKESKRMCKVCKETGHTEDTCELLKCKHCDKWNHHFSHACPDAPVEEEKPRLKDLWRRIPTHLHKPTPPSKLRIACYHCAASDHFGDDCPRATPLSVPGSFSLTDINTCGYASQEWLLTFSDKLDDLEAKRTTSQYGVAGTIETIMPAPDPFKDLRKLDDPPPSRKGSSARRDTDNYRPPRGINSGAPHRPRSPVRNSEVFNRFRDPPARQTHGLPPRPPPRSPPRHRAARGGAPQSWGRPSEYDRVPPPPRGGPGRPLPNEALPPPPRRGGRGGGRGGGRVGGESFRPGASSAKESWKRYKT